MPLLDFWRTNRNSVLAQSIRQVVAMAGEGDLRDNSDCSRELRAFLREVGSADLAKYAAYCLENSFDNSGLVLQDVINELGRRLDFDVEDGLYRGRSNRVGFDGIWRAPDHTGSTSFEVTVSKR